MQPHAGEVAETHASAFDVSFDWSQNAQCFNRSPQLTISKLPEGTNYLASRMKDFDSSDFNHDGGRVEWVRGQDGIPDNALSDYQGSCSPQGEQHTYEFTVEVLDAKKSKVLGKGVVSKKFSE